jgi:acetate kinase
MEWIEGRYGMVSVRGVGHRVVHGGPRLVGPAVLDGATLDYLRSLVPLAPLHQPRCLAAVAAPVASPVTARVHDAETQ